MSDFHVHQMTDNKLKPMWCEKCGEITKHSCSCNICTPQPDAVEALAARESDLRSADALAATADRVIEALTSENDRLREALLDARLVVASQPIDALGTANNGLGAEWPIRDELLSKIDKALTPTEPSKDDLVIEGKDGDLIIPTPEIKE